MSDAKPKKQGNPLPRSAYLLKVARKNGCQGHAEHLELSAQRKGFKSHAEYCECLKKLRSEGFRGDLRVNPSKKPEPLQSMPRLPRNEIWVTCRSDPDYYRIIYDVLPRKPRAKAVKRGEILEFPGPIPAPVEEMQSAMVE